MKPMIFAAAVLLAGASSGTALAASAPADVTQACTRAVADYAWDRDTLNVAHYATLFTDDAEISFGGRTFTGKAKIVEELTTAAAQRPRAAMSRHFMSDIRIDRVDATTAHGTAYLILYVGPINADGSPSAVGGPVAVGAYDMTFKLGPAGCRVYRSKLGVDFRGAPAPAAAPAPRPGG